MLNSCLNIAVAVALQTPALTPDEKAIHEQSMKLVKGWNAGSGKIFAEPFAKDADYVVINGMKIKTHRVIEVAHQQIFDTVYKGSKLEGKVESLRFVRPDVAITHMNVHRTDVDGRKQEARATLIFVKNDGTWLIESFQNTPVQAVPGR